MFESVGGRNHMSDQEVYKRFIEWLGKTWWRLPKSEHLIPTVKAFYTPEEAELLTDMPFKGRPLEELAGGLAKCEGRERSLQAQ
jgi:hypothetical protein